MKSIRTKFLIQIIQLNKILLVQTANSKSKKKKTQTELFKLFIKNFNYLLKILNVFFLLAPNLKNETRKKDL